MFSCTLSIMDDRQTVGFQNRKTCLIETSFSTFLRLFHMKLKPFGHSTVFAALFTCGTVLTYNLLSEILPTQVHLRQCVLWSCPFLISRYIASKLIDCSCITIKILYALWRVKSVFISGHRRQQAEFVLHQCITVWPKWLNDLWLAKLRIVDKVCSADRSCRAIVMHFDTQVSFADIENTSVRLPLHSMMSVCWIY